MLVGVAVEGEDHGPEQTGTTRRYGSLPTNSHHTSLSKHYKKEKEEAAAAADGSSLAPDFNDLETPAEVDDGEDDEHNADADRRALLALFELLLCWTTLLATAGVAAASYTQSVSKTTRHFSSSRLVIFPFFILVDSRF